MNASDETALTVAANFTVRDFLCVKPGEQFLITADTATDQLAVRALLNAARVQRATAAVVTIPQLPFQGMLADPYVPEPLAAAIKNCDVWIDLTFPYLAGSKAQDEATKTKRARCLMCQDLGAEGIARIFGGVDFDRLFRLQNKFDDLVNSRTGKTCRVTNRAGTDVTFVIGRPVTQKIRRIDTPGMYTPPGSGVIYPETKSVRGTVVIDAAFHEYFALFNSQIRLEVDGQIRSISGGGGDLKVMDRALKRAGGGKYGSIIHFTHGFHPAARFHRGSFMESIRATGNNAIGFGIPWWEPGGGENHPDGVTTMQSMWIDNEQIVRDGAFVPAELALLEAELSSA